MKLDPVSTENVTYAKSSLGLKMGSNGQKVLGLSWDFEQDTITLELTPIAKRAEDLPATKRNTLRLLAGIFDPLGMIGPITITAKILFQEACRQKINWDDPLDGVIKQAVEAWIESLIECKLITINRCLYKHVREEVLGCSLHGFADASKKAYCAVIYFVYQTSTGTYSKMLTSKTRVAPLKELSIPRLELIARLILAKPMSTVKNALNSQVSVQKTKLWSDSMPALYWIRNQGEWKQFVSHRVNEIVKLSKKEDWGHCPSEQNPADTGSRGSLAVELKGNEMWWHGPSWLIQPEDLWPRQKSLVPTIETCEEERKVAVMTITVNEPCGIEKVVEINKYSTLRKLYRVTAWVARFCHNISRRNKNDKREGALSLEERVESEELWIKMAQRELRKGENYQQLLSKFGLQEDQKSVIRCKGRLEYPEMVHETKEPITLPKNTD